MRRRNHKPTISLCMIVRDEERFLRPCLESVRGVVDEMVVVDTGSRDSTVAIAKEFGARVLEYAWNDDFAAARNQALRAAKGRWMLALDADERLDAGSASHIREASRRGDCEVGFLKFVNVTEQGPSGQEWLAPRLYRIRAGMRYIGRIHEQVVQPPGRIRSRVIDAVVYHHGYTPSLYSERRKRERTVRLLERALEDPEARDPLLRANYLFHYANQATGPELIERYERFVSFVRENWPEEPPHVPWITGGLAVYARLLHDVGRLEEARAVAGELLQRNGESPPLRFVVARALAAEGDLAGAEHELQRILQDPPLVSEEHLTYTQDVALARGRGHFLLGLIREKQGRLEEAVRHHQAAVDEEPEEDVLRSSLVCAQVKLGRYAEALQTLEGSATFVSQPLPGIDCLALILAVLTQSVGRLAWWGEKVRQVAPQFPPAAALLERLQSWDPERGFRLEDFPEIVRALALETEPGAFVMPQMVRRTTLPLD